MMQLAKNTTYTLVWFPGQVYTVCDTSYLVQCVQPLSQALPQNEVMINHTKETPHTHQSGSQDNTTYTLVWFPGQHHIHTSLVPGATPHTHQSGSQDSTTYTLVWFPGQVYFSVVQHTSMRSYAWCSTTLFGHTPSGVLYCTASYFGGH